MNPTSLEESTKIIADLKREIIRLKEHNRELETQVFQLKKENLELKSE